MYSNSYPNPNPKCTVTITPIAGTSLQIQFASVTTSKIKITVYPHTDSASKLCIGLEVQSGLVLLHGANGVTGCASCLSFDMMVSSGSVFGVAIMLSGLMLRLTPQKRYSKAKA